MSGLGLRFSVDFLLRGIALGGVFVSIWVGRDGNPGMYIK